MTISATTADTVEMRRCTGTARFGIDPHEAPISDFPKQPSRKDGLGTMCAPHWKAYVKGLADDRKARPPQRIEAVVVDDEVAFIQTAPAKTTTKRERRRTPMVHIPDPKVIEAEALIAEVDALPADQLIKRVGDDDVQAAFETVGQMRAPSAAGAEAMEA